MASSYFDEHDCEPLAAGQTPDFLAQMARLLVDTGAWDDEAFAGFFNDRPPPPASKQWVEKEMETKVIRDEGESKFDF